MKSIGNRIVTTILRALNKQLKIDYLARFKIIVQTNKYLSFINKFKLHQENGKNNTWNGSDKKKLKHTKMKTTDESYNETSYYLENGLRKVYPYYFKYQAFTKGRWMNRSILDVLTEEFYIHSVENNSEILKNGMITINGSKVYDLAYKLKHGDFIESYVHRHEGPVAHVSIQFIHLSDDLVVINKPSSIPLKEIKYAQEKNGENMLVHPAGRYRHNSLLFILAKEFNLKNLHAVHRLDILTSGILMLARNIKTAKQLACQLQSKEVTKEYICRVEGRFPHELMCEEPIECLSHKLAVYQVGLKGKKCKTEFLSLGFNGKESLVLCKPYTGRTHQIRVHLQYLGYPIINDPLYNNAVFGPQKGKDGITNKDRETLLKDVSTLRDVKYYYLDDQGKIMKIDQEINRTRTNNPRDFRQQNNISSLRGQSELLISKNHSNNFGQAFLDGLQLEEVNEFFIQLPSLDVSKFIVDPKCPICHIKFKDPKKEDLTMCLHALYYKGPNWEFRSKLPDWVF